MDANFLRVDKSKAALSRVGHAWLKPLYGPSGAYTETSASTSPP